MDSTTCEDYRQGGWLLQGGALGALFGVFWLRLSLSRQTPARELARRSYLNRFVVP